MRKTKTLEATAYHEAGHAVAALHLGIGIGRKGISIVPAEEAAGWVHRHKGFIGRPDVEVTGAMRLGAERNVVVSFAGEAAQRRFDPHSVRRYHADSDRRDAVDLMIHFTGSGEELEAYLRLLAIRAKNLVALPVVWLRIEAVAEALLSESTLTAKQVRMIYTESARNRT